MFRQPRKKIEINIVNSIIMINGNVEIDSDKTIKITTQESSRKKRRLTIWKALTELLNKIVTIAFGISQLIALFVTRM
jgi:hypothetical protein